jgi:hypothetical protein
MEKIPFWPVPFSTLFHRICEIPWERGFSICFRRIPFSSGIDPYLFDFLYHIFNLGEICLEVDMFINILITNYAC